MDLTVREVAALTGQSPRTVRAQVARGELPGAKRGGVWRIPRHSVPLTEAQRRALQARADEIRDVVDGVLPSRLATTRERRSRSVADLAAFQLGAALLREIEGAKPEALPDAKRVAIADLMQGALLDLAEGVLQYERDLKLAAINRARAGLSRALATLLLRAGMSPEPPVLAWVAALERDVLPAVAGLARWAERLGRTRS